jgi:hypothetical protein
LNPFLHYIKSIYPKMRHWRVGAWRTKEFTPSQYELWGDKLHLDYSDAVLNRPLQEHPMSIITAIDRFDFYYMPTMSYTADGLLVTKRYEMLMVEKGQAITFTYEMLHAGGPNAIDGEVFVSLHTLSVRKQTFLSIGCFPKLQTGQPGSPPHG